MEFAIKFLSLICMIAQKILCLISSAEYFFCFCRDRCPKLSGKLNDVFIIQTARHLVPCLSKTMLK